MLGRDGATDQRPPELAEDAPWRADLLARDEVIGGDLLEDLILRAQHADVLVPRQRPLPHLAEVDLRRRAAPGGGPGGVPRPPVEIGEEFALVRRIPMRGFLGRRVGRLRRFEIIRWHTGSFLHAAAPNSVGVARRSPRVRTDLM